jgi:hypothetical protein
MTFDNRNMFLDVYIDLCNMSFDCITAVNNAPTTQYGATGSPIKYAHTHMDTISVNLNEFES